MVLDLGGFRVRDGSFLTTPLDTRVSSCKRDLRWSLPRTAIGLTFRNSLFISGIELLQRSASVEEKHEETKSTATTLFSNSALVRCRAWNWMRMGRAGHTLNVASQFSKPCQYPIFALRVQ